MNKSRSNRGPIIIYAVLLLGMLFALFKLVDASGSTDMVYSDVVREFQEGNLEAFAFKNNTINVPRINQLFYRFRITIPNDFQPY